MDEDKRKHLEFIQHIITRMNTNSFQIKKMAITVIAAFIAIYVSQKEPIFILITNIPLWILWTLDAYYLQQERKFRGLYNDVVANKKNNFSMDVSNYTKNTAKKYGYFNVFFSDTIWVLYLLISILLTITYLYLSL